MLPPTTTLSGSGGFQAQGGTVCVPSDITSVSLSGIRYTAGAFTVPGSGTVTFKLDAVHHTGRLRTGGIQVVVNGGPVEFHFRVDLKAKDKTKNPPAEDPAGPYEGRADLRSAAQRTVHAGN
ncbi:hypothetical protein E4099_17720 [Streptomyces palmae]|uniref:Uncharacterized protein n=2 Tax=Streptomyces palmae TaxID=1701085 RepID=A0A4Z0H5M6_9ACTN|nr:hypothetical protein E4099_17720 [Streptomyces palmae]